MQTNVSGNLQEYYDTQYENHDERWRLVGGRGKAKNIINITAGLPIKNVLDVGSGDGAVLHWLDAWKWNPDINSLEISESGLAKIKARNLPAVKSVALFDGYKIPFEDQSFDLVTCSHVLGHVEHYRILLREIRRVSKYQVFEVPIDFSFKLDKKVAHFLSYGHINIFTPQTFRFLLQSENFKVLQSNGGFYDREVYDMLAKDQPLKKWASRLKNFVWKTSPLMILKPHVLTVLTSSEPVDKG